jgi:hypothetical protein
MRQLKILIKDENEYTVHLLDLEAIRNIILTVTAEPTTNDSISEDPESAIESSVGDKIKFEFAQNDELEIDIGEKPIKFIVYDDYGFEYQKTEDPQELIEAIIAVRSNDMEVSDNDDPAKTIGFEG